MNKYNDKLTDSELHANYEKLIAFTKKALPDSERTKKLLKYYDTFANNIMVAPAAGKAHFHYAFEGGYVLHILNVCKAATAVKQLYKAMNGTIDFTDEEMYFSALNHDLGKIGDEDGEYYIWEQSEWHREKQGTIFKANGNLHGMEVTDRALFQLQKHGIQYSIKEFLAIKCSDGLYDDANESYLKTHTKDRELKTNLPYIIHTADFLSCKSERDEWRRSVEGDSVDL